MKKLRVWTSRDRNVIDGRKIGLTQNYGYSENYSKLEAEQVAAELMARHTLGIAEKKKDVFTLDMALKQFFAFKQTQIESGRVQAAGHYANTVRDLKWFADCKHNKTRLGVVEFSTLAEIDFTPIIETLISRELTKKKLSSSWAASKYKSIKMLFTFFIKKQKIAGADFISSQNPHVIVKEDRSDRINPDLVAKFLATGLSGKKVNGIETEDLKYQAAILVSFASGLRSGELRALPWKNVFFENDTCVIKVTQAVKANTSTIGEPKTKNSVRDITINPFATKLLKEWKLKTSYKKPHDLVFPSATGYVLQRNRLDAVLRRCEARAGVQRMKWGDGRHYFASAMLKFLGEDWMFASQKMGHQNAAFTKSQYGHYIEDKAKDQAVSQSAGVAFPT